MATDITLADMLESKTSAEVQAEMEAYAKDKGLPVSAWTSVSTPKILIAAFAKLLEDFYTLRRTIASMGFVELATGDGLTLLAFNLYGLDRTQPGFAEGLIVLEDTAGAGPYTIAENQLWIESESGFNFNNITGGTLIKNGSLILTFKAEESGVKYNSVGTNSTWGWIGSPLAGVELTNPEAETDSGDWLIVHGRGEESDELLRERCRDKWPSSGLGMTASAWEYHTTQASADVTRVKVRSNPGGIPGLTGIVVAGTNGELSDEIVANIDTLLQPKKTLTTTLTVSSAVNRVIEVSGTIYVANDYVEAVTSYVFGSEEDDIESVLKTYQREVDIGGKVYKSRMTCALQDILSSVKAVKYVVLDSPEEVIELEDTEIAYFDFNESSITIEVTG